MRRSDNLPELTLSAYCEGRLAHRRTKAFPSLNEGLWEDDLKDETVTFTLFPRGNKNQLKGEEGRGGIDPSIRVVIQPPPAPLNLPLQAAVAPLLPSVAFRDSRGEFPLKKHLRLFPLQ